MRWKVEEYDNNISERSIRVVDEDGKVICDNEPYYPTALNPEHAHLIAAAPQLLAALKMARAYVLLAVNDDGGIDNCEIGDRLALEHIDDIIAKAGA